MEAEVIHVEFRKKEAPKPNWGPQYFCLRCDGSDFRLSQMGVIHCGGCGSMMRNIYVTEYPPEKS